MRLKLSLTIAIAVVIGAFALTNWGTLAAPTRINLLLSEVQAPLGVIMLITLVVVMLIYLILLAAAEGRAMMAQRRTSRELERLRRLADQGEESRITELRTYVEKEFAALHDKLDRAAARPQVALRSERDPASLPQPEQHASTNLPSPTR